MSGLINMTIKQVIMRETIPFDVSMPKKNELLQYFSKEFKKALKKVIDILSTKQKQINIMISKY